MSFIYEDGLPVGYECGPDVPEHIRGQVEERMLAWYRRMAGQTRQRIGKRDMLMGNTEPNLRRMENE